METCMDGPTTRRMYELADKADAKGIKVGVGLMVRHCRARQELFDRIQNGEIGDIINMRAYRMCMVLWAPLSLGPTRGMSMTSFIKSVASTVSSGLAVVSTVISTSIRLMSVAG